MPPGLPEQKLSKAVTFPQLEKKKKEEEKNYFRDVTSSEIIHVITPTGLLTDLTSFEVIGFFVNA